MTMQEALHEIIVRAPSIAHEAAKALRAPDETRQIRYNAVVIHALRDPEAQWTQAEREQLMEYYVDPDESMSERIYLRVTPTEKAQIEAAASAEGLSTSAYLRRLALFE